MTLSLFTLVCACPACLFTGGVLVLAWRVKMRKPTRREYQDKARWN